LLTARHVTSVIVFKDRSSKQLEVEFNSLAVIQNWLFRFLAVSFFGYSVLWLFRSLTISALGCFQPFSFPLASLA
jgi:hypothetical protein